MRGCAWRVLGPAVALAGAACTPIIAPPAITPLDHLPALKGDYFPLQSREAGHLYHIYVRLPYGYAEQPDRRYPIVNRWRDRS